MSAFMVEDKTINRVVSWLEHDRDSSAYAKRQLKEAGFDTDPAMLGQAMFALNVAGVNERYGDGEASDFRPLDYRYEYTITNQIQALKSLQCWLYQCSEGDVPELPLYKIMDDYANSIARRIVSAMPKYDAAEWG